MKETFYYKLINGRVGKVEIDPYFLSGMPLSRKKRIIMECVSLDKGIECVDVREYEEAHKRGLIN